MLDQNVFKSLNNVTTRIVFIYNCQEEDDDKYDKA